jgi:predicted nucleic acid-binding protein
VEWIRALRGQTVALDTAPLIYFIEQHPDYAARLKPFFQAADRREFRIVTSLVTLIEVLVHPLRHGRADLASQYRDILLRSPALTAFPIDETIAEEAARLRAAHRIKTPDAIQLATAIRAGAACFLTNDANLPGLPGVTRLVVDLLPAD